MITAALVSLLVIAIVMLWRVHARRVHRFAISSKARNPELPLPSEIGGLSIEALIHQGTKSSIYQARWPGSTQSAAIKLYHVPAGSAHAAGRKGGEAVGIHIDGESPTQLSDPRKIATQRADHEYRVLQQCSCPNIVSVWDYPAEHAQVGNGAQMHLIMESLSGSNLQQVVARHGPMSAGGAMRLLAQVCDALEHVHQRGLFHGDISPTNIMLCWPKGAPQVAGMGPRTPGWTAKLIDFELAGQLPELVQSNGQVGGQDPPPAPPTAGRVRGTPAFMAPEVANASGQGAASDLYSLGCVAYFMLTGQPPFSGRTSIEICWKQANQEPPELAAQTSGADHSLLAVVVTQLLKKHPDQRPQSAAQLKDMLSG